MSETAPLVAAPSGWIRALEWAQMSTQRQLAVAVGVSSTLFLAMARVVFAHVSDEQADGHVVNVAGRQRMLSQRIAREAFADALGECEARSRLEAAAAEFEGGLHDLLVGAPGRGLPRSSIAARERLRVVQERWPAFLAAIDALSTTGAQSPALPAAITAVARHADAILEDSERVVAHFDQAFSGKVYRLRTRMTALALGGIGAMGATYLLLLHGAHQRAERAEAAVRGKEHELEELADERRDLVRRLLSVSEDERRRVAADIHDGPTQQLMGAAMLLEASIHEGQRSSDASPRVEVALQYLESAVEETRRIISDLRPPLLDDVGVAEALRRSLQPSALAFGVELDIDASSLPRRPVSDVELTLYRVAHEAVANALKHAHADTVRVHIAEQQGGVLLVVGDSGTGFDPATVAVRSGHRPLGLLGMRERVELLGGRFAIRAVPGEGTTVTAWLPTHPMEPAK